MKTSSPNNQSDKDLKQTDMHSKRNSGTYFVGLFIVICTNLTAQPGFTIYTDLGENNVSGGLFIKSATMGHIKSGKNRLETGFEINLKNNNHVLFSGYTINASRFFLIKSHPIELQGFCTWAYNSQLLRETNLGALLNMKRSRFEMKIGTNFRTYAFRNQVIMDYGIDKSSVRIHENFNIMYLFVYYFKKADDHWNIGLTVTNIDRFTINQETNPELSLRGLYKPGSQISLYAESWYKTAGAPNLAINHFGIFIRTGIIWNFN